jgi:hypothetical protein
MWLLRSGTVVSRSRALSSRARFVPFPTPPTSRTRSSWKRPNDKQRSAAAASRSRIPSIVNISPIWHGGVWCRNRRSTKFSAGISPWLKTRRWRDQSSTGEKSVGSVTPRRSSICRILTTSCGISHRFQRPRASRFGITDTSSIKFDCTPPYVRTLPSGWVNSRTSGACCLWDGVTVQRSLRLHGGTAGGWLEYGPHG